MTVPDLTDVEARAAYRRELRGVASGPRRAGLILVVAALGLLFWSQNGGPAQLGPLSTRTWAWIAMGLGCVIWIGVMITRTRYHKARMAEPPR